MEYLHQAPHAPCRGGLNQALSSCCTQEDKGAAFFLLLLLLLPWAACNMRSHTGGLAWRAKRSSYGRRWVCQQILQEQSSACGEPKKWRDASWGLPSGAVFHKIAVCPRRGVESGTAPSPVLLGTQGQRGQPAAEGRFWLKDVAFGKGRGAWVGWGLWWWVDLWVQAAAGGLVGAHVGLGASYHAPWARRAPSSAAPQQPASSIQPLPWFISADALSSSSMVLIEWGPGAARGGCGEEDRGTYPARIFTPPQLPSHHQGCRRSLPPPPPVHAPTGVLCRGKRTIHSHRVWCLAPGTGLLGLSS